MDERSPLIVPPGVKVKEEKQRLQIITHFTRMNNSAWSSARTRNPCALPPQQIDCSPPLRVYQHNGFLSRRCVVCARAAIPASGAEHAGLFVSRCWMTRLPPGHSSALQRRKTDACAASPPSLYYNSLIYSSHLDNKNNE